jgi:hypothetical protein
LHKFLRFSFTIFTGYFYAIKSLENSPFASFLFSDDENNVVPDIKCAHIGYVKFCCLDFNFAGLATTSMGFRRNTSGHSFFWVVNSCWGQQSEQCCYVCISGT